MPEELPGVVDMVDRLDIGVRGDCDGVEAAKLSHLDERRLELAERLHVRLRPHMFVAGKDRQAVDVLHRHDGPCKAPFLPCPGGALLRLDGVFVDIVAGETVFGGDEVGRDALGQEIARYGDAGIDGPGAARRPHADPAHRFDAAADGDVLHARHHLRRREVHRVEARGAEPVDLDARHVLAEARLQDRGAGDVAAGFADGVDAAEHHVLDDLGIESVALPDRIERRHGKIDRRHLVKRAVGLAATARRAHGVVDKGLTHKNLPRVF